MNKRLFYETPLAELILVRFEENIMSVTRYNGFTEEEDWDKES